MRFLSIFSIVATACVLFVTPDGESQDKNADKAPDLAASQELMRDKLVQVNRVLEGITLDDFDRVKASAKTLRLISRRSSWHIPNQTPQYKRLAKNFVEQASDLERHAEEGNAEAATLDLVRMNITCTHCHQHMREESARRK